MSNKTVYLDSIGCRLNQSEIQRMARQFEAVGYRVVDDATHADLHVVNTCAVTKDASKSSRKLVRHLHRQNEAAEIAVTGCYAHIAPDKVAQLPGVRQVIDNIQKDKLVALVSDTPADFDLEPLERQPQQAGLTRAYIKVQDGCDNACTFCITTLARGDSRSRPMENIIREIQTMADGGYHEAVLTGVNMGDYGQYHGGLRDLVAAILQATDIRRVRLSSVEPWNLDASFFQLWQNPRLCRHLHIPLQSGCDQTLKRMRRRTSQAEFRQLVEAARRQIPGLALSTDVIVGFPGETEAEFQSSYAFIAEMDFMKIHVFPYSVREGTPAAKLRGRISKTAAKERVHAIQALSAVGAERFCQAHIGQTVPVLWEGVRGASEDGFLHFGLTDNYIKVEITHPEVLTNQLTSVYLQSVTPDGMNGIMEP